MGFSLWSILKVCILCTNALAILNEGLLKKCECTIYECGFMWLSACRVFVLMVKNNPASVKYSRSFLLLLGTQVLDLTDTYFAGMVCVMLLCLYICMYVLLWDQMA